ncbi:hypothetical protein BGZ73_001617, partial [Actinomortierella ambigua]
MTPTIPQYVEASFRGKMIGVTKNANSAMDDVQTEPVIENSMEDEFVIVAPTRNEYQAMIQTYVVQGNSDADKKKYLARFIRDHANANIVGPISVKRMEVQNSRSDTDKEKDYVPTKFLPFLVFAVANKEQLDQILELKIQFDDTDAAPGRFEAYKAQNDDEQRQRSIKITALQNGTQAQDVKNALQSAYGEVDHVYMQPNSKKSMMNAHVYFVRPES